MALFIITGYIQNRTCVFYSIFLEFINKKSNNRNIDYLNIDIDILIFFYFDDILLLVRLKIVIPALIVFFCRNVSIKLFF